MSANVETMFYTREVPWHGLGTRVEEAPTSEEALRLAGLDWKVQFLPVSLLGIDKSIPGFAANVRSSDSRVLGIVSERYKILQNSDAFAFTDALLGNDVQYETAGALNGGKMVWLLARMPSVEIVGDKFENFLCFRNSHDGKSPLLVICTPVRVVCQNTLNLAIKGASRSWSTKHAGNLEAKMKEAHRTLELNSKYMEKLKATAEYMVGETLTKREFDSFTELLMPFPKDASEREMKNVMEMRDELTLRYYEAPDLAEFRDTEWGVIQAVSDFVTHRMPKRNTDTFAEKRFEKVLNGDAMLDKAFSLLAA